MKLRQTLNPHVVKRLQKMVFVGTYKKESDLHFSMQCLSPLPEVIREAIGEKEIFSGLYSNKNNERIAATLSAQENKQTVCVFRLRYEQKTLLVEMLRVEMVKTIGRHRIIPVPQLQKGQRKEILERKLEKGYVSFLLAKYPSDFAPPELLLYEGRLYGNLALQSTFSPYMYVEQKQQVQFVDMEAIDSLISINVDDQLYFVLEETYELLKKKVKEQGTALSATFVQTKGKKQVTHEKERSFLQAFKHRVYEKKLFFEETDLYNFHVCMKTAPITILGGMPGIGKSQLVEAYGEALGLSHGKDLLWVSCSPSFEDMQDILGYLHPNGTYIESETGLVRLLHTAEQNPEKLYMIVFDEMNVSHIEHWFTAFLSLLELDVTHRILPLYAADDVHSVPPQVVLGENLLFVGTVNFDETTKELSDRLLDRVNLVSLKKIPFREALHVQMRKRKGDITVNATDFRKQWVQSASLSVFTEEELEFLDTLHVLLQEHDSTKGVSFRVASAIATYVSNIPYDENQVPFISREEAIDLQIKQRILTKIRGVDTTIGVLLTEDNRKGKSLFHFFRSPLAKEVSDFVHSLAYMKQKAMELELYGYAK